MHRFLVNATIACALIATGWAAAKAQGPEPNFEIIVDAPGGATTIKCVRGCKLAWVERGINPNAMPIESFDFACSAPRCSSFTIGGWITP
jgi:hypothetical protein